MMRANVVLLLAAALVVSAAAALAGERQIADLKEIAGTWQGWTALGTTESRVMMVIRAESPRAWASRPPAGKDSCRPQG